MKNETKLKIQSKINQVRDKLNKLIKARYAAVDVMDACDINCDINSIRNIDSIRYELAKMDFDHAVGKINRLAQVIFKLEALLERDQA